MPNNTAASEIRYLEVGWSVQSRTRSYDLKTSRAVVGVRWDTCGT